MLVCETSQDAWPGEQRSAWIRECVPGVSRVHRVDQDALGISDEDSAAWAGVAREALGGASPDVVMTSEAYGETWAAELGCRHEAVDPDRVNVPISGTQVRGSVLDHLEWLEPPVRRDLALRVCVAGAESTGKTTLCGDLAERFEIPFVPEFGRYFCEAMAEPTRYTWSHEDFETIARTQTRFERDTAEWVGALVLCDTTPHTTSVFEQAYLGRRSDAVSAIAEACWYDLVILTDVGTPFQPDDGTGLRDESARDWMHEETRRWATRQGAVLAVSGSRAERLEQAAAAIDELLRTGRSNPIARRDRSEG